MEKHESSLVPEWMRGSGHGSGTGSSNYFLSSSSLSDSSALTYNSKNRNSRSRTDVYPFLDRSSSTKTGRGSSNGSTKHAYSSFNFNRSNRDRDRSREKDRLRYIDPWDHDTSIPLGTFLIDNGQELLRRSHSMTVKKQDNHLAQGFTVGYRNGGNVKLYNGHAIHPEPSPVNTKGTGFDKDFPLLKAEERNAGSDVVMISSPGQGHAVQSLSVGNPALTVGESWTSALAEVPSVIEKTGDGSQANVGSSATLKGPTCRNMAEALVQAPVRTGTAPQTQTLEDRAIRKSRQLIPVVLSAPKGSVLNSSDKSKTKPIFRNGEAGLTASRNTQQQSSVLPSNLQSNPGSQMKPDTAKKLVVLKLARENGVGGSPPNSHAAASQLINAPSSQFTGFVKSINGPREPKGVSVNTISGKAAEKKTQSRNAFYSALKHKTSANISTDPSKTNPSSAQAVKRDDIIEVAEKNSRFEMADRPDEKEAEFLKSLGWDESNSEEDEALTEAEIKAFIEQCKKFKPSLVQKLPIIYRR